MRNHAMPFSTLDALFGTFAPEYRLKSDYVMYTIIITVDASYCYHRILFSVGWFKQIPQAKHNILRAFLSVDFIICRRISLQSLTSTTANQLTNRMTLRGGKRVRRSGLQGTFPPDRGEKAANDLERFRSL